MARVIAKQIQRWLGHHRASFTLDTYVHLLDEELPEGLDVHAGVPGRVTLARYAMNAPAQ